MVGTGARNPQSCEVWVVFCFIGDVADLAKSAVHVGPEGREYTQVASWTSEGRACTSLFVSVCCRETWVQGKSLSAVVIPSPMCISQQDVLSL